MGIVEEEVLEALDHVRARSDFLMAGGAGSGKTHSMESFIREVYAENPQSSIVCITYTNVAVNEIRNRLAIPGLQVFTIHEFLWELIRRFQKNIRQALTNLVNNSVIRTSLDLPVGTDFWEHPIRYKEWLSLEECHVSHAEVLLIARSLFEDCPLLAKILGDLYDYLLVDEYQDTPVDVLEILLEVLPEPAHRSLRVGFFGDIEQAIYEGGKSRDVVKRALDNQRIKLITKRHNRRNPAAVMRLIGNLRTDGLIQVQAVDVDAPNYGKEGTARFIYTNDKPLDISALRGLPYCSSWDFTSSEHTKLLYLGKSAIARENSFPRLMEIYSKDRAVEYAKTIDKALGKIGVSVDRDMTFGEVIGANTDIAAPTRSQQRAFDDDPDLLSRAYGYTFRDLVTTSVNSDRLLGTKKVSELDDRDRGEKRDPLINHLMAIQFIRAQYSQGSFNSIIRSMSVRVTSIEDRVRLAQNLDWLSTAGGKPVGEVVDYADSSGLVIRRDAVQDFQKRHPYRCARVFEVPFDEVAALYSYVEDFSPFSTQHGVKGSEWDNVFVSLDNGGWNMYNYDKLLGAPDSDGSVESRSRMMLYVTCSRAKENLIVYAHAPSPGALRQAREWFGDENVLPVG